MSTPTFPSLRCSRRTLRRVVLTGPVVGLLALVLGAGVLVRAQDATPTPMAPMVPGTTVLLGRGVAAAAPGYALLLQRVTYQPGDVVMPHVHPGAEAVSVESGTLGYTDLKGDASLTRGGTGTPTPAEQVTVGTEILLQPGDSLFQDEGVVHTVRAVGDAPVVLLLARLFATDQPGITFTGAAGTPTP